MFTCRANMKSNVLNVKNVNSPHKNTPIPGKPGPQASSSGAPPWRCPRLSPPLWSAWQTWKYPLGTSNAGNWTPSLSFKSIDRYLTCMKTIWVNNCNTSTSLTSSHSGAWCWWWWSPLWRTIWRNPPFQQQASEMAKEWYTLDLKRCGCS